MKKNYEFTFSDLSINWDEYELYLRQIENRSINNIRRIADYEIILESLDIKTDDSLKHKYFRSNDLDASVAYTFPDIRARLLVILEQGNVASVDRKPECLPVDLLELANAEVKINNREIGLIFDQTNFTCEYGGLCSDKGFVIVDEKLRFKVNSTRKRKGYIIHNVQLIGDKLLVLILFSLLLYFIIFLILIIVIMFQRRRYKAKDGCSGYVTNRSSI